MDSTKGPNGIPVRQEPMVRTSEEIGGETRPCPAHGKDRTSWHDVDTTSITAPGGWCSPATTTARLTASQELWNRGITTEAPRTGYSVGSDGRVECHECGFVSFTYANENDAQEVGEEHMRTAHGRNHASPARIGGTLDVQLTQGTIDAIARLTGSTVQSDGQGHVALHTEGTIPDEVDIHLYGVRVAQGDVSTDVTGTTVSVDIWSAREISVEVTR